MRLSTAAAWLLAGAAAAPAVPAGAETVLRARLNSDVASLDPGMKRDENTDAVLLHIVEGLVASRADGSVAPMLASGWTVSPDGRRYRFALRRDVSFHNGRPLTSAAVLWSLRRYFDPQGHWRCKADFGAGGIARVTAITADDRYSVTIALDRPAPMLLKEMARADCGGTGILDPASVNAAGRLVRPIGTGPFRFAEWRRNQYVDLVRFAGYRPVAGPADGNAGGKRALVDRIRFAVIPDGSAASAALLRGSLDVLDNLAPNELAGLAHVPGIRIDRAPTTDLYALLFQTRDPLLADPRLRRALALGLDVAALARVAARGTATADSSPIPAASPYHGPAERPLIGPDLARARALVAASGYRGQPIRLITNRRYPQAYDSAIIVQAMARAIGVTVEIETLDWASQLARYIHGDYQAMLFGYSARLDPALTLDPLIGDKAADPRRVWDDPAARAWLARARAADRAPDRQRAFDAIEALFRRDQPAVVLFNSGRIAAVRAGVQGYRGWAGGTQRLWNVGKS